MFMNVIIDTIHNIVIANGNIDQVDNTNIVPPAAPVLYFVGFESHLIIENK